MLQNLSDLDFDLSKSLKLKCDSIIGISSYALLLMFNSNIWSNSAPLRDIGLRNLSDLEFHLSRSSKVKYNCVIGLPIYAFLLTININISPNSAPLQDIRLRK